MRGTGATGISTEISCASPFSRLVIGNQVEYKQCMPTVHRERGFDFYFYAEEGNEPAHMHVDKGGGTAKVWLKPVRLAWADGLKVKEIRQIMRIAKRDQARLLEKWNEFSERKS